MRSQYIIGRVCLGSNALFSKFDFNVFTILFETGRGSGYDRDLYSAVLTSRVVGLEDNNATDGL